MWTIGKTMTRRPRALGRLSLTGEDLIRVDRALMPAHDQAHVSRPDIANQVEHLLESHRRKFVVERQGDSANLGARGKRLDGTRKDPSGLDRVLGTPHHVVVNRCLGSVWSRGRLLVDGGWLLFGSLLA